MPQFVKPLAALYVVVKLASQLRNSTNEAYQNYAHEWISGGLLQVSHRQKGGPLGASNLQFRMKIILLV